MREILFRGKTLTGRWVEGAYYKQEEFYGDKEDAHIIITSKENLTYDQALEFAICIPETVGQYTGLTDKNGTKIFEDDIVKCDDDIGAVSYSDLFAKFRVTYNEISGNWFDFEGECCDPIMFYCEVIGNIHDNPELLGGNYCG